MPCFNRKGEVEQTTLKTRQASFLESSTFTRMAQKHHQVFPNTMSFLYNAQYCAWSMAMTECSHGDGHHTDASCYPLRETPCGSIVAATAAQ